MPYIYLLIAIITEIIGTSFLKSAEGFTKLWPTLGTLISFGICFYFLSTAMKYLTTKYFICNMGRIRFSTYNSSFSHYF
ncbi:multidrug resistance efflux protein QacC [Staphylococcus aureus]|nr:multidrug resistance efflux protein QacC [Staphylococcus aureus]